MENQDWKLGLREETIPIFEAVSQMEVVKGLYLCGGTAQSLQMKHGKFSRHTIHSKFIYSILLNENYFNKPEGFILLEPIYNVSTADIAEFIRQYIEERNIKIKK